MILHDYPIGSVVSYAMFAKYKSPEYVKDKPKFYREILKPTLQKLSHASPEQLVQDMGFDNLEHATKAYLDLLRQQVIDFADLTASERTESHVDLQEIRAIKTRLRGQMTQKERA